MADVDTKVRREADGKSAAVTRSAEPAPVLLPAAPARRRFRVLPLLITLAVIAVAVALGRAMWDAYMGAPWDPRWHGAGLCRDDGAASRRPDRRVAGR